MNAAMINVAGTQPDGPMSRYSAASAAVSKQDTLYPNFSKFVLSSKIHCCSAFFDLLSAHKLRPSFGNCEQNGKVCVFYAQVCG